MVRYQPWTSFCRRGCRGAKMELLGISQPVYFHGFRPSITPGTIVFWYYQKT